MLGIAGKDPEWLDRVQATMTVEDRKELIVGMCLTMAQLLQRAARRYEAMDAEALDALIRQRGLGMLSMNEMGRKRLEWRLKALRDVLRQEYEAGFMEPRSEGEGTSETPRDMVLMAGLPLLWGDEEEQGAGTDEDRRMSPPT